MRLSLGLFLADIKNAIWFLSSSYQQRLMNLLISYRKTPWTRPKRLESNFLLLILLILLPTEVDSILQKKGCKRNLVWPGNFLSSKIVFTLLAKVVVFHVGPTIVEVQGLGLELVSRPNIWGLKKRLDDFVQILFILLISTKILGSWNLQGSIKSIKKSLGESRFVWP